MEQNVRPMRCPRCGFPLEVAATDTLVIFVYCPVCESGTPATEFIGEWQAATDRLRKALDNASNN